MKFEFFKMYAVSLTPHGQYEQPWPPSKGISIKNIYVLELSDPSTTKTQKFEGAN
jgi:hypothetical protein